MSKTKHSLLMSVIALILCASMLIGTTFAWFTDSVTSSNNIIKSGTLDVSLEWMEGKQNPADKNSADWKDASKGAIFNYSNWEPGFTQVKHIKIENEGTLALKYKVNIIPTGTVEYPDGVNLADVIDVYYLDPAEQIDDRTELPASARLGTLTEMLGGLTTSGTGTLKTKGEAVTITLALKMQESAGNVYQNRSFGTEFAVQLLATQLTYEPDSFDNKYDTSSEYPVVSVPASIPATATEAIKVDTNNAEVSIPAQLLNDLPAEIEQVSLAHTQPKVDAAASTITFDSIELIDQDGKIIDLEAIGSAEKIDITLPVDTSLFIDGTAVAVFHDGEFVANVIVANGKINYQAAHLCEVSAVMGIAVANEEELIDALTVGGTILLTDDIDATTGYTVSKITRTVAEEEVNVDETKIIGFGHTISRTEATQNSAIFTVASDCTLTLADVTLDGGAVWTGEVNEHLLRGTENSGMTTGGALVTTEAKAHLVLEEGAVLQNNDGANAVFLGTRVGATLTVDGGEILNNHSAAGAIWGGGAITINSGKVNGNHGGIGGAIRVCYNVGNILTMNGGEMNHNVSDDVGGAIWAGASPSSNKYVLNGGEMAYNYSPVTGGAMYVGYKENLTISGDFKMHHNTAPVYEAIRFHDHASFIMTGGEIYSNGDDEDAIFLNNNSTSITGGKITGNFGYSGGVGLTWGEGEIDGVVTYNLSTNHNTAYLATKFNPLQFKVNEENANFSQFNFKPAADYVYTEGDEEKLICLNEGYETYWDAAAGRFKLQATVENN